MMPQVRPVLLVPFIAMVALSGCIDEEGQADAPTPTATPEEPFPVDLPVDVPPATETPVTVPVPHWPVGTAWRYTVDGAWVGKPHEVSWGVVARDADRYVLGADAVDEVMLDVTHGTPFAAGLARDDLAVRQQGDWQSLVRFDGASDATWTIMFYGRALTMRSFVTDLPGPDGPSPGIRSLGTNAEGHRLVVDYHGEVAGFTRITWTRGDTVLLRYVMQEAHQMAPERLSTWRVAQTAHVETSSILPVESRPWTSDGRGDLLVVALHADAARVGRATVWDPQVRPAVAVAATPDAAVGRALAVADHAGTWRLAATSLGTLVSADLYQVDTTGPLRLTRPAPLPEDDGLLPVDRSLLGAVPLGPLAG